ncbi:tRNA (adenine(22)-N(1))-methyltransferase TrmK [Enterovibrio sp. ZSDZ35]|uniref:tRNA (Adenine(22)-N(1))-methyltransferase TrmK n=1 Tax=Enterovibrio qingdaonensis TaxID=2899818 RepID=A0ABT5QIY3_9GAMM|nr:tRNA (adenine(22)-N(1))-methyltransferase TrmK [Enterovibrio sp. ZSDZ35]MDD1780940.1 tRNA (adenine(22)-N(1))-methyltransferase TrmK [Enterovibrio sp. ZSDZ35]
MKIGKRLRQLQMMVNAPYDHIWDCCCDHGLLGASLLREHPDAFVHFVDVVPALIDKLSQQLRQHFAHNTQWEALCMDAGELPLAQHSGRHLIIIAGIGGDLMMDMVARLQDTYPEFALNFLLCPVNHQYALREMLIARGFKLKEETLIEENQRFYEIMLVTTHDETAQLDQVTRTGSRLWLSNDDAQRDVCQRYLAKTLQHYQRIQQGRPTAVEDAVKAYQSVDV